MSVCFKVQLASQVQFRGSVISNSLRPHGLQHARLPCLSPIPGAYSNSCPLSQWCHPTISSSVIPFSSCLQSFPASGSFPMSQFFTSGGQSIGASASASVLPMNIQDWFLLGLTGFDLLQNLGKTDYSSNVCTNPKLRKTSFSKCFLWRNCNIGTKNLKKIVIWLGSWIWISGLLLSGFVIMDKWLMSLCLSFSYL